MGYRLQPEAVLNALHRRSLYQFSLASCIWSAQEKAHKAVKACSILPFIQCLSKLVARLTAYVVSLSVCVLITVVTYCRTY